MVKLYKDTVALLEKISSLDIESCSSYDTIKEIIGEARRILMELRHM